MFDLTGKTALVTGATGGIGGAVAKALHGQGAHVVLSGTRAEKLEGLAAELGERVSAAACNLSDPEAVSGLVAKAEEAAGAPIDILVSNAGLTRDGLLLMMKEESWDQVIDVNLKAYFLLAKAALRGMMKRRWGRIIGVASVVGVAGNPGQANYAASKAGMIGFTKSLAQEVASRGVTANIIAPGYIETPMTEALPEAAREAALGAIPTGRLGLPEDIAAAAVYLASEEASYVTGATIHVNGGMYMV